MHNARRVVDYLRTARVVYLLSIIVCNDRRALSSRALRISRAHGRMSSERTDASPGPHRSAAVYSFEGASAGGELTLTPARYLSSSNAHRNTLRFRIRISLHWDRNQNQHQNHNRNQKPRPDCMAPEPWKRIRGYRVRDREEVGPGFGSLTRML